MVASSVLNLAGTLDLSLAGGFTPTPGDSFTILTGASRAGTFDVVAGLPLTGGLGASVSYTGNAVIVVIGVAGDTDGDVHARLDHEVLLGNEGDRIRLAGGE